MAAVGDIVFARVQNQAGDTLPVCGWLLEEVEVGEELIVGCLATAAEGFAVFLYHPEGMERSEPRVEEQRSRVLGGPCPGQARSRTPHPRGKEASRRLCSVGQPFWGGTRT